MNSTIKEKSDNHIVASAAGGSAGGKINQLFTSSRTGRRGMAGNATCWALSLVPTLLINCLLFLTLSSGWAQPSGFLGYLNKEFLQGDNLFMNPFLCIENTNRNTLSSIFHEAAPNNSSISLWDPASKSFTQASTYNADTRSWSSNLELLPGTGALFTSPASFTNTIVGFLLNPDGTIYPSPDGQLTPPPPVPEVSGIFLMGCKSPIALNSMDTFLYVIGREPRIGEKLTRFSPASHSYMNYQYLGLGQWDTVPQLNIGEAAFFTITVPEPSTLWLGFAGLAMAGFLRFWGK